MSDKTLGKRVQAAKAKIAGQKRLSVALGEETKDLSPFSLLNQLSALPRTKESSRPARRAPTASIFSSILSTHIDEENKARFASARANSKDILLSFGLSELWHEVNPFIRSSHTGVPEKREMGRPSIEGQYKQICNVFSKLSTQFHIQPSVEHYANRSFSEDFIYVAILSIQHTYNLIITKLSALLDWEGTEDPAGSAADFEELFGVLKSFNDFFFIAARLKCNTTLPERHLQILMDACKLPFTFLQQKVQHNLLLIDDSPIQQAKRKLIAFFLYHVLQTMAALAIFGEPASFSKLKYENVLERFKTIFALLAQSASCDKIFCEPQNFEQSWETQKHKCVVTSFDQKRLSIFLPKKAASSAEPIAFSLRYVVISYNYKILKIIAQRIQLSYDEHILSVFSNMVYKNRAILGSMLSQKQPPSNLSVTLVLNENVYIIRSYILNLTLLSENLDPIQRQTKYETIREVALDSLQAAVKLCSHNPAIRPKDIGKLSIGSPKDLLALIFRALLTFRKCLEKNPNVRQAKEIEMNVNVLITDIISRPVPTDDPVCFHIFKIYLLQYIKSWDMRFLKERHAKYTEEMSRYLSGFDDDKELEDELVQELNKRVQELALEIFVGMASMDCGPAIETTVALVRDSFANEKKLRKFFYVLCCILTRRLVPYDSFAGLLSWDREQSISVFAEIEDAEEVRTFVQRAGMRVLFTNFRNTLASYKQTREQTKAYGQSRCSHRKTPSMESNSYVIAEHLKKLGTALESYKVLLEITASFICAVHNVQYFAEYFLLHSEWARELPDPVLLSKHGQKLVQELMVVLLRSAKRNEDALDKYVSLSVELLRRIHALPVRHERARTLLMHIKALLKGLLAEECESIQRRRTIMYEKAVIPLMMELCKGPDYMRDVEAFLELLRLVKLVSRNNPLVNENLEAKTQLHVFLLERTAALIDSETEQRVEIAKKVLDELVEVAVDDVFGVREPHNAIIRDILAMETYYEILCQCFKRFTERSDVQLAEYVLAPMKVLCPSLLNLSIISRSKLPQQLLRIFKRTADPALACEISNCIGSISSVHSSPKQMKRLLKYFVRSPKGTHQTAFLQQLLDTLLNVISGEYIQDFFHFCGSDTSFITLADPVTFPSPGVFYTGYIRLEQRNDAEASSPQCIFSFMNTERRENRGFELFTANRKLTYRTHNLMRSFQVYEKLFAESTLKFDYWHHVTLLHQNRELVLYLDSEQWTFDLPETAAFPKSYNVCTVGAKLDPDNPQMVSQHFFGELSALCFFSVPQKPATVREVAFAENFLTCLHLGEKDCAMHFFELPPWTDRRVFQQELVPSANLVLDPRQFVFNEPGKDLVPGRNLQKTRLFFNRPGKEVFSNLGGLSTALPLIMERPYFHAEPGRRDMNTCIGVMRLIHCLCLNGCVQAVRFLTQEHGLELIQHFLEKVGKYDQFSKAFVDITFNVLSMQIHEGRWKEYRLAPLIVERLALNMNIWVNSEFAVQVYLLDRVQDFLAQQKELNFSHNEPFNSLLLMLFDYLTPEENDVAEIKDFLSEIRGHIQSMLLQQLAANGTVETAASFVKYLLPDADKFNQIRDTLRIIVEYQRTVSRAHHTSIFEEYVNATETPGTEKPGLVTSLFLIIHMAISHRQQLNAITESVGASDQAQIDCTEELIASCMEILLSFCWSRVYDRNNELVNSGLKYSIHSVAMIRPPKKSLDDRVLNLLKPSWGFKTTEEIIVAFLVQRQNYAHKRAKYEKRYLGQRVYKCMFSRICKSLPDSLTGSSAVNPSGFDVSSSAEVEVNAPFARLFYRSVMQNVGAFELRVREAIFRDLRKMLSSPQLYTVLLNSEDIALAITKYLSRRKYVVNPAVKGIIQDCVVMFVTHNWGKKEGRSTVTACLKLWTRFNAEIFIDVCKDLVNRLTLSPQYIQPEESTHNILQLLYTFEDFAVRNSLVLASPQFLVVFSTVVLLLDKAGMLYFWYPSFGPQAFQHEPATDLDSRCTQREGGAVRVVLRLLFAILLKIDEEEAEPALQTLSFFIFHTKPADTAEAIMKSKEKKEEAKYKKEGNTFVYYSLSDSIKHETMLRKRYKTVSQEKGVVQQRTLSDLSEPGKDVYESPAYKLLLLVTYIEQVTVYTALDVTAYKEISLFGLDSAKAVPPPTKKLRALLMILGRLLLECECDAGVIQELDKRAGHIGKLTIKNCTSDIDMLPKEFVDPGHSGLCTPQVRDGSAKHLDYGFGNCVPGSDSTYSSMEATSGSGNFKDDLMKLLGGVRGEYLGYLSKKEDENEFAKKSLGMLLAGNTIRVVQAGLHECITEDFKLIDKAIFAQSRSRRMMSAKLHSAEKIADKAADRFEDMKNMLQNISKNFNEYYGRGMLGMMTKGKE